MTDRASSEPERAASPLIGEEQVGTPTPPRTNLIAAVCLAVLAIAATVIAVQMPNPGELASHPGLLPALTGVSLAAMAIGLGVGAVRAGALNASRAPEEAAAGDGAGRRTALLIAIIVAYVICLDFIAFEFTLASIGSRPIRLGSFEFVTVPVLALILRIFWGATVWRCAGVATVVVVVMAAIFRYGFVILLPGS